MMSPINHQLWPILADFAVSQKFAMPKKSNWFRYHFLNYSVLNMYCGEMCVLAKVVGFRMTCSEVFESQIEQRF